MVKRTGPTNYQLQNFTTEMSSKTLDSAFWKRVCHDLLKPTRQRRIVNIYKINKFAKDGETVVVPGKVLSLGEINKNVNVAALSFSQGAKRKIEQANGKTLSIEELFKQNPEGKRVRILG